MAFSIPRRAWSSFFSSAFAASSPFGGLAQPVVGEVAQLLLDRPQLARPAPRRRSRQRLLDELGGMADGRGPRRRGASRTRGWRTRRRTGRSPAAARIAATLRSRTAPDELGLGDAVRAAGAAAQAVVVELDQPVAVARARCGPRPRRAARGGGGTGPAPRRSCPVGAQRRGRPASASHSEKSRDPGRERPRRVGAEQAAVVLHRRAAARRCRRRPAPSPGNAAMTRCGQRAAPRRPGRRGGAARRSSRRPRPGSPGRAPVARITVERGAVDVALPRVHHAAGEQERVRVARRRRAGCAATGARSRAARTGAARGGAAARPRAARSARAAARGAGARAGTRATRRARRGRGPPRLRARRGRPP